MEKNLTSLAKISRPRLTSVLSRERLFSAMDKNKKKPVTWITGPAGSGKTTLAASYLDKHKIPCLWYQLDENDDDLATFFYYMGVAAWKAAPRYKKHLPYLSPEYMPGISVFCQKFFEALCSRLKPPFAIVFDNYHEVPNDSMLHSVLFHLLARVPEGIRVFVMSRNEMPTSHIRLRANESVHLVGWNDLRFTLAESTRIIQKKETKKLTKDAISLLHEKTEGWIAGLILLIESSKMQGLDYRVLKKITPQDIFEYFASEIFRNSGLEIQEFLLKTAFLTSTTAEMAEALTGVRHSGKILSQLHADNYFIEKHQEPHVSYHYHPLFKDFLIAQAKLKYSHDAVLSIQRHSAVVLAESGHTEDAAALLIEMKNWEELIPLILDYAQLLINQGRCKTLREWLAAIPQSLIDATPGLLYWEGICRLSINPVESRTFFERAFHIFNANGNKAGSLSAWSGAVDTFFFEYDGLKPLDPWIIWLDEHISEESTYPSLQIETRVSLSMAGALAWRMPDHPRIKEWVNKAVLLSQKTKNNNQSLQAYQHISYLMFMGRFEDCALFVKDMKQKVRLHDFSPLEKISLLMVESVLCQLTSESASKGVGLIKDCIKIAEETGLHILDPAILGHGVYTFLSAGDAESAGKFLAELEKTVDSDRRMHTAHYYHIAAWYHQVIGDYHQAVALARKAVALIEEAGAPFPEAYARLGLALALHETGDDGEAFHHLAAAKEMSKRTGSMYLKYLTHLASAHFAFDNASDEEGREAVRNAMLCGRQNNYTALVNFWRPDIMAGICRKALEADIETIYVQKLIRQLDLVPDVPSSAVEVWPWEIKIKTFDSFEIWRDGKRLEFSVKAPRKLLAMLKLLIACGPKGAGQEELADMLWPESGGDVALQALDTNLHRLRQLLKHEKVIQVREGRVKFDPQRCWIDAHAFEEMLRCADDKLKPGLNGKTSNNKRQPQGIQLLERATRLYTGPFLDKTPEPWALAYRERLRIKYLKAVQRLGLYFEHRGYFDHAVNWYEKGLEIDDVSEPIYQNLMKCYRTMGRTAEAVSLYQRCRRTLKTVLRIEPSPETESLYKSLISNR